MRPAAVIAVAGLPGAGKTALVEALRARLGNPPVLEVDDFNRLANRPQAAIRQFLAAGAPFGALDLSPAARELELVRHARPLPSFVLLETAFGRVHDGLGSFIDFMVWIDAAPDLALARKLGALGHAAAGAPPEGAAVLLQRMRDAAARYADGPAPLAAVLPERARGLADLVVGGNREPSDLAAEVCRVLAERLQEGQRLREDVLLPPPALSAPGAGFLAAIEALDRPFGLERSIKLAAGADPSEDRFIATFHIAAFAPEPAAALGALVRDFGMPRELLERFLAGLGDVEMVHFGFEGPATLKLYFELGPRARLESRRAFPGRELVHIAAKWSVDRPQAAVTRYFRTPGDRRPSAIAAALDRAFPAAARMPSVAAAGQLLETLCRRCAPDALVFLEVEDEATQRRSFDINAYAADLSVLAVAQPLRTLMAAYGLDPAATEEWLGRAGRCAFGHLSGGTDRVRRDFATIYYGMEARHGASRG